MLTNAGSDRVRAVRALARRSVRDRQGRFVAEGPQAVREALACRPDLVTDLYVVPGSPGEEFRRAIAAADPRAPGPGRGERTGPAGRRPPALHEVSDGVLAAMAGTDHPQGVLCVCRKPAATLGQVLAGAPRLLVLLSHVRDPGNAGTVIRSADAFGADAVLVSDASVDAFNPKTVRATAGSVFHLPVVTGLPVAGTLAALRAAGVRTLAADGRAPAELGDPGIHGWLAGPHAWVLGNEAWGLPESTAAACDASVRVPIHGRAESLNLAMAATVCLYASAARRADGASRPSR